MAFLEMKSLRKVFPDGTEAVRGVDLAIEQGEFVVLLGPSGCGKTTTLRMIAGLDDPTGGTIHVEDEEVTYLRPGERDIGFVFQFYTLYPHMRVARNLAFPLENTGVSPDERAERVTSTAAEMGITHLLDRYPHELSGGDQQKVSVARAMIRHPRLWLMDEPLGTIDADKRIELREWIRSRQLAAGVTTIYVTHDQEEAMSLADRVVIMNEGLIEQEGTPAAVYDRPASLFAADFIGSPGMNLIKGAIESREGAAVFVPQGREQGVPLDGAPSVVVPGATAVLGIRGEFVRPDEQGSLEGTVTVDEFQGSFRSVYIDIGQDKPLIMRAAPDAVFQEGRPVRVSFAREHISLFAVDSGKVLA